MMQLQGSREIGCEAKIRIKCCTTYPDHALPDTITKITSEQAQLTQQTALDKLHKAIERDEKVNKY